MKNIVYRLTALVVVLVVAFAVSFTKASPAEASLWSQCPPSNFCIFTSYFGENSHYPYCTFPANQIAVQGLTVPANCNNNSKAWYNRTVHTVVIIDAGNCSMSGTGWRRSMVSGQQADGRGSDWINRVSSINRPGNANFCGV